MLQSIQINVGYAISATLDRIVSALGSGGNLASAHLEAVNEAYGICELT